MSKRTKLVGLEDQRIYKKSGVEREREWERDVAGLG
jgi:hypothetical protein